LFTGGKPSILIVDDDTAILHTFSRIFEKKGYIVTVAEEGKAAIEKLNSNHYDVALVDFCLPDMEGNNLFPFIKNSSPETLRIMLTGKIWSQNSFEGADAFVGKPINPEKLLSIIDTKLKNRDTET
jgi:DNA-binding NtrC family response regulator